MSLPDVLAARAVTAPQPTDRLRESWRQVFSMKRSTQQFKARLKRTLPLMEYESELDPQFAEVAATMASVVRILDWTLGDLEGLRLPDELVEVVPVQLAVTVLTGQKAT